MPTAGHAHIFDWADKPRTGRALYVALAERIARARNPYATLKPNTTAAYTFWGDDIAVRLHRTDILTVTPTGTITLNWGGWNTPTTNGRMCELLPVGYFVSGHAIHIIGTPRGLHPVPPYVTVEIGPRGAVRYDGLTRAVKPYPQEQWRAAERAARKLT